MVSFAYSKCYIYSIYVIVVTYKEISYILAIIPLHKEIYSIFAIIVLYR